ncbi:uncharacterized protein LOC143330603 [Chaetodon auriga]|uniref:uncharacterized protein LOC143330603 n=1 Tax=Chaetodon auriga TaxID=39042 RepID=UPI0040330664
MRIFLGVFMVLIVSGEGDDETITGVFGDSVLLPCTCPERNLDKEFKWQMEEPNTVLVLKHNLNTSVFTDRYDGRAQTFLAENSQNCSVLLSNITTDDLGRYRCVFYSQGKYKKFFVNLNITASYNVCQKDSLKGDKMGKVFQCDATGRYREAELQWSFNGTILTNSFTTGITHSNTLDASTGLYRFTSKLITTLNGNTNFTCDVKAKGISTVISRGCSKKSTGLPETVTQQPDLMRYRYVKIIPIMMVFGFILLLRSRWESSWSLPKKREVMTGNF